MKDTLKSKLELICQTLEDKYGESIPCAAIDTAIMDNIGISQITVAQYKKALLGFNYMSIRVPKKLWRINHGVMEKVEKKEENVISA